MLFLDESGHSGTERFSDGKWNWEMPTKNQPFFILVGFICEEQCKVELENIIAIIKKEYKIQGELKYSKKSVKDNFEGIVEKLSQFFKENDCQFVVEVVDKRYCISKQIVEYCVTPYYRRHLDRNMLPIYASIISKSISDTLLNEFAEMFDSDRKEKNELLEKCNRLRGEVHIRTIRDEIDKTIEHIQNSERFQLKVHNLFPSCDGYIGNKTKVAISPQIDSLNGLLCRTNEQVIIHDEIGDLKEAIIGTVDTFNKLMGTNKIIQFRNSKKDIFLQIADLFAGYIGDFFFEKYNNQQGSNLPEYVKSIIYEKTNVVADVRFLHTVFPLNFHITISNYIYEKYIEEMENQI